MRTLAVCADDYGQSAAIDRGILRLAAMGRLTEVSCLSGGATWPADASALTALPAVADGRLRIGLHFNLTQGRPLAPALAAVWPRLPSLLSLLLRSHLGRLPGAALAAELHAQWQAFVTAAGRQPAHLDGHQHVHHLPGVRPVVLARIAATPEVRIRDTARVAGPGHGFKRRVIAASGGRALRRALQARQAQANTVLIGVHDFKGDDYRTLVRRWLKALPPRGGLLFCHPGEADPGPAGSADPIAAARVRELAYLGSDDFAADLREAGVRLGHAT